MKKQVTVITAVHAPSARWLGYAHDSLASQELPAGWDWQWLVQEDGETDAVAPLVPDDPRVSFAQGRHGRAGVARTMALARATGDLVRVLDADDILTPGALARDIEVLEGNPDLGWTTSRVLDLLPDGGTIGFDNDPPAGQIASGAVYSHWLRNEYRAPVHPATLCVRRPLLLALGGWMALPASEDTGLLMALDAVSSGWFSGEAGLLYRKWSGQVTSDPAHSHEAERDARIAVITQRVEALRATAWCA